jgi:hypothetical protein
MHLDFDKMCGNEVAAIDVTTAKATSTIQRR